MFSVGTGLKPPCPVNYVGAVFINGTIGKYTQQFQTQPGFFGDLHGFYLANNSVRYNLILLLDVSFGNKKLPVVTLSFPLLDNFIQSTFMYVHILESFQCVKISCYLANVHQFLLSLPLFSPTNPLSCSSLDPPVPFHPSQS